MTSRETYTHFSDITPTNRKAVVSSFVKLKTPIYKIAKEKGISQQFVARILKEANVYKGKHADTVLSEKDKEEIITSYVNSKHVTARSLAEEFNVSRLYISKLLRENNIQVKHLSVEEWKDIKSTICKLWKEGRSTNSITKSIGQEHIVTRRTVARIIANSFPFDKKISKMLSKVFKGKDNIFSTMSKKIRESIDHDSHCEICGKKKDINTTYSLVVDHCHNSNKIRGLLCGSCNTGLGMFKDNADSLRAAIKYLKRYND